jgi:hypothetical protein
MMAQPIARVATTAKGQTQPAAANSAPPSGGPETVPMDLSQRIAAGLQEKACIFLEGAAAGWREGVADT